MELLTVATIVGVLVMFLMPAVQAVRESARRSQCKSNLHQVGIALHLHSLQFQTFPAGCLGCKFDAGGAGGRPSRQRFIAWTTHLLPYLEQAELWEQFDFTSASYASINKSVGSVVIDMLICPSEGRSALRSSVGLWKGFAFTDYGGIYGVEGSGRTAADPLAKQWLRDDSLGVMLYEEGVRPESITDGLGQTVAVAEMVMRRRIDSEWVNGQNVFAQEASTPINVASGLGNEIGSAHPGGAIVAFCDGHVALLADSITQRVLTAMLTKAGSESP